MKNLYDHAHEGAVQHEHMMHHEAMKKHSAGGHTHHSEHFKKHAAGTQYEQDKVRAMCGGGMTKGKK